MFCCAKEGIIACEGLDHAFSQVVLDEKAAPGKRSCQEQTYHLEDAFLSDGSTYTGQWAGNEPLNDKPGYPCGKGKVNKCDGSCYEGYFAEGGKAHGTGKLVSRNGNSYQGQWVRDHAHGRGMYVHADGSVYDGEWMFDEKDGHGIERWSNGQQYSGQFKNCKKHGAGVLLSPEGSITYLGQLAHDSFHGNGTFNFSDGRCYTGSWRHSVMSGCGQMIWPDGTRYVGCYAADKRHGEGSMTWPDGSVYKGQWANGSHHGKGVFSDPAGHTTEGTWIRGQQSASKLDDAGHELHAEEARCNTKVLSQDAPRDLRPTTRL